jgi:hypothetical protein
MESDFMLPRINIVRQHLPYEIDMLEYTFRELALPSRDQGKVNVLIECFCLHARNLIDFFWKDEPLSGSMACATHFTSPEYANRRGPDLRKSPLYGKLSTQIVHLSYKRTIDTAEKIGPEDRQRLKALIEAEIKAFPTFMREPYKKYWPYPSEKQS